MDRVRKLLRRRQSYEPLEPSSSGASRAATGHAFSWTVYMVFLLLGVAMLWAWNGLMAAAPYFQRRFKSSKPILDNFQATELAVSTVANLGSVAVLAKLQANASYPRRIVTSLVINSLGFTLLAISTKLFTGVSAGGYLGFLVVMVFASSMATGFMQNGSLAYVATFQRSEYMQAIMLGQAVAGVLPPIVQIVSSLSAGETTGAAAERDASTSAFAYFLAATGVSVFTLLAFSYLDLVYRPSQQLRAPAGPESAAVEEDESEDDRTVTPGPEGNDKKDVPLTYLARRLFFSAAAVFLTFGITMMFPVFTQQITTTNPHPPPLLQNASFIPLGLLVWNVGDLIGRIIPLAPRLSLATRPKVLFVLSILRVVFIPLYLMCNIKNTETQVAAGIRHVVLPDVVYLLIVQLPFGISNGYLGSCCMMGAGHFVEDGEGEAAGAFMGLVLVAGLAVGSFASFLVGNG